MASRKKVRVTRAERSETTRRLLIESAAQIVGELGYNAASIARITMAANVAQGTIYNYFESRDDLFAHLLPEVGRLMIEFIAGHVRSETDLVAKERARINGYLMFLETHPGFYRVLQEAETFAPEAHREHMQNMVSGYCRALRHDLAAEPGAEIPPDAELEAIVYMLLGARNYLAMLFFRAPGPWVLHREQIVETYMRLVEGGLFGLNRSSALTAAAGR